MANRISWAPGWSRASFGWARVAAVAVGMLVAITAGCSSDEPKVGNLASGCHINSDCVDPLSCTFGSCHAACKETRDCATGERCVKVGTAGVCQRTDEATCTYTSMCSDPLKCAVDGKCRAACLGDTDCLASQKCASFVCADPDQLDPITMDLEHNNPNGYGAGGDAGEPPADASARPDAASGDTSVASPDASTAPDAMIGTESGACPLGKGTCEGDPTPCTQNVYQVTQCGDCKTTCDGTHGSVSCPAGVCVVASCSMGYGDCDGKPETGCETNLVTDSNNCGACKHACVMTTCKAAAVMTDPSLCDPKPLAATGTIFRNALGGGAMFLTKIPANPPTSFTIVRTPVDGSAPTDFAADSQPPGDLVAVGNDLWYAEGSPAASIFKKPLTSALADAPTLVFTAASRPLYMSLRGTSLYWIAFASGSIVNIEIFARSTNAAQTDAGTRVVTGTGGVYAFGTTADAFYWLGNDGKLYTAPIGGGTGTEVVGSTTTQGGAITVDDTYVYFTQRLSTATDGVFRYKTGGVVESVVYKGAIASVLADATNLYFTVGIVPTDVFKSGKTATAATKIASSFALGLVKQNDATFLYMIGGGGGNDTSYRIVK